MKPKSTAPKSANFSTSFDLGISFNRIGFDLFSHPQISENFVLDPQGGFSPDEGWTLFPKSSNTIQINLKLKSAGTTTTAFLVISDVGAATASREQKIAISMQLKTSLLEVVPQESEAQNSKPEPRALHPGQGFEAIQELSSIDGKPIHSGELLVFKEVTYFPYDNASFYIFEVSGNRTWSADSVREIEKCLKPRVV